MKLTTALSENQLAVLRELADQGWAVVVWTPDELDGLDPEEVEDTMIQAATSFIAANDANRA